MKPLGKRLAGLLSRALPDEAVEGFDVGFDAVVPMPLHWRRRWRRGFNQSEILARLVAKERRILVLNAVKRVRATAVQAGLTNSNRRKNVAGAFRVSRKTQVAGKRILLIDDVMTTGATAAACASALKRAGARSVRFSPWRGGPPASPLESTAMKRSASKEKQR